MFERRAKFTVALLKVASRCNLDCDYCYVYHHVDQTWRAQPKFMSQETIKAFGYQLNRYLSDNLLDRFSVIFHGGEPLLCSADGLVDASRTILKALSTSCEIDFSVQTNGHLLTEDAIQKLENADIGVSLSLDGPRQVNDLHRIDHHGNSTFDGTYAALQRLIASESSIFQGIIAVIDPDVPPREILEFFSQFDLPGLDLLLPDATHCNRPFTGESQRKMEKWLNEAFEVWYRSYSHLPIRFFDAILGSRLNLPSPTDALGFGAVSLIVIDTDGSYTDHDVFKITENGVNQLHQNVSTMSLESISEHPKLVEHAFRLTNEGVAQECKVCPALSACGGGSVMHRYHPDRGFDAPTVYCQEMFSLLANATRFLRTDLAEPRDISKEFALPCVFPFTERLIDLCREWRTVTESRADKIASDLGITDRSRIPAAAVLLRKEFKSITCARNTEFANCEPQVTWLSKVRIQQSEGWLSLPFKDSMRVVLEGSEQYRHGLRLLADAEKYLHTVSTFLPLAISELISDILFVESTLAQESGIFSFSDDSAPNVLYVAPYASGQPLAADDFADSIFHEFLHHVLYHIELATPLLYDYDYPSFPAPWRSGLRPSGGFLHGTFVFSGLALFWDGLARYGCSWLPGYDKQKAVANAATFKEQAIYGLRSIYNFALLTPSGLHLVMQLSQALGVDSLNMRPPGAANLVVASQSES